MPTELIEDVVPEKLIFFLNKISDGSVRGVDESFFDQLLTTVSNKKEDSKTSECIATWFHENILQWARISQDLTRTNFLIQLFGVICKEEVEFLVFLKSNAVNTILCPSYAEHNLSNVRCSYIMALSDISTHGAGREWIKHNSVWKTIVNLAQIDCSIYVQRKSREFIRLILNKENNNEEFSKEITEEVISNISKAQKASPSEFQEDELEKSVSPVLRIITALLDDCIANENANALPSLLIKHFQLDVVIKNWSSQASNETFLDTLVTTYGTLILCAFPSKGAADVSGIMELYSDLLDKKRICAILTLSRVCHMNYARLRKRLEVADSRTEMHFFILQLMPLLVSLRKRAASYMLDQYVNKLINEASEDTFRMAYRVRDVIREENQELMAKKATRTIHGVMAYHQFISRENVVIFFQGLTWVLKNFIPSTCEDLDLDDVEVVASLALCDAAPSLLCAVLQALCSLLKTYHIAWSEAFEGLCLAKFCYWLLTNPNLNTKSVVLTLRMARLTIEQCMPPSLVLAMDRLEGTSLEVLGPQLVMRLHDPRWEVRDSTLEVFAALAHLSLNKHPAIQDYLVRLNCGYVAISMAQGDCESYVRASALQVISAMVPVDKLWTESLAPQEVGTVVMSLVKNDSEAVVRREAALLITQLLKYSRVAISNQADLHDTMLGVSVNDLHWEVRVNAVTYWTQLIDVLLEEEGMVDGIFPPVTFSKATKKIVTLTVPQVQTRLRTILDRLSQIGCLNALLAALQDECDHEVAEKAVQALKRFSDILAQYQVVPEPVTLTSGKRKCSPDRTSGRCTTSRNVAHTETTRGNADRVIEGIVNSSDLNLLAGVVINNDDGGEVSAEPATKQAVHFISVDHFLNCLIDVTGEQPAGSTDSASTQLSALLDDVLTLNGCSDANVPDCY